MEAFMGKSSKFLWVFQLPLRQLRLRDPRTRYHRQCPLKDKHQWPFYSIWSSKQSPLVIMMYNYVWYHMYIYIYMAMSQNCVWNVPRCSGRMERRGFVTGLVPDLWNVMKYKLYININMYTVYMYNILYTSSTAQGGGGSFKNRKPIGEVGCCESGMAERSHWLTERWLELCLLEWL